jgi:hypothetical protein
MIALLVMVVILGLICWALCELVSALVGIIFIIAAMGFLLKMAKEIFK